MLVWALPAPARADASCESDLDSYKGTDAGRLVVAFGASPARVNFDTFALYFRSQDRCNVGRLFHLHDNIFFSAKPDITEPKEEGEVWVWSLKPGNYEFFNFEVSSNNGFGGFSLKSQDDFSIPFTIKARQTIYLGDFRAMPVKRPSILFGIHVLSSVTFVVTDQSARDVPIAKAKDASVGNVEIAVPDLSSLDSPFFKSETKH